jgi:hypothetical protein
MPIYVVYRLVGYEGHARLGRHRIGERAVARRGVPRWSHGAVRRGSRLARKRDRVAVAAMFKSARFATDAVPSAGSTA